MLVSSCDADSDVLADYVLALISPDDPDDEVRSNCLENLEDFLREREFCVCNSRLQGLTLGTKIRSNSWKTCWPPCAVAHTDLAIRRLV